VTLEGRVVDQGNRPLAAATVSLTDGQTTLRRTTDPFGWFRFADLKANGYILTVELEGFLPSSQELELTAPTTHQVEVTLEPTARLTIADRVTVVGNPAGIESIPGSAHYVDQQEFQQINLDFGDIHHVLRRVPGINIQEEEGFGLRPNIGLRGSGTERSSTITLMEDGVLIAPAPYAAPAAYYFPTVGRMSALEVRKGSSQIKYGPRTNGGAINLLSTSIPDDLTLDGTAALGEYSTRKVHAHLGDSYENVGWLMETYQIANDGFKELDGGGDTGFDLEDYLGKLRFNSSADADMYQELELKFGYTDQNSDETYLGLTDDDFRQNPLRRYRASQLDKFDASHEQYQARYFLAPSSRVDFTATLYRNNFKRKWYKLQSVLGAGLGDLFSDVDGHAEELAIVRGEDSEPDALTVRANNRKYYSQGVEAVVGLHLDGPHTSNLFQFGLRYHEDQEDRFQHDDKYQMRSGSMILTSAGAPGSNANRISDASAWAFFVQDTIEMGRFSLVPGIRYERIELVRTDFASDDPNRSQPTNVRTNELDVFIPGIGASYQFDSGWSLFGGIHRGFAPPGPGSTKETKAEESINYEAGIRINRQPVKLFVATFYNDYDNLLGADTLSSGGTGEGDLFNGGSARVVGLESSALFDLGRVVNSRYRFPIQLTYTLTDAEFRNSFQSGYGPWGNVQIGDEFPYLPRHQFFVSVGMEGLAWRTRLESIYVGRMRTVAGQSDFIDSLSTESALVFNVSAEYDLQGLQGEKSGASLYVSLRNLANDHSIVSRHPAGVRPGLPATLMGGIRFRLGR